MIELMQVRCQLDDAMFSPVGIEIRRERCVIAGNDTGMRVQQQAPN